MHFPSLATIIALTAATVAEASKFNLEIGYFSILVPPIGGNIPGIGCGPWGGSQDLMGQQPRVYLA
ncbi:hypothetical protein SNK04_013878 [Fusarium graminearum]